jgi:hypothetical protein
MHACHMHSKTAHIILGDDGSGMLPEQMLKGQHIHIASARIVQREITSATDSANGNGILLDQILGTAAYVKGSSPLQLGI